MFIKRLLTFPYMNPRKIDQVRQVLKWSYGLLFVVVGLDKVTMLHLIVDWNQYVGSFITDTLALSPGIFLVVWGIAEILIGLILLSKATRTGAWLGMAALAMIVINLVGMGEYFDIAARDIMMAIGLYVLASLSDEMVVRPT
jgi:hypothetical protein